MLTLFFYVCPLVHTHHQPVVEGLVPLSPLLHVLKTEQL